MKEIDTEPGLHICKAIDLLLEHAQNEDCFTTFNGICLAADRSTSKGALLDKYDEAMAENRAKRERQKQSNDYTRGYAEGLEAAANTVRDAAAGMPISAVVLVLANEAKRVREMGVQS